jgi:hypothetical protein
MVLAAYDRCVLRAQGSFSNSTNHQGPTTVTEGEVLLQFFSLFSKGFNPSCQGIDIRSHTVSMIVDLTPDQQITIAGGGFWIVDPLTPHLNVARPSFAFRQMQEYFRICLQTIEVYAASPVGAMGDSTVDYLKLLGVTRF